MSHAEELSRLAELHKNGDLSDDEFAMEKNRLIQSAYEEVRPTHSAPANPPKSGVGKGCGFGCLGLIVLFAIFMAVGNNDKSTPSTPKEPSDMDAFVAAVVIVPHYLKSPSSAEFPYYKDPGVMITKNSDGSFTIYSPFQAANSFGAKLQSHFRITVRKDGEGWKCDAPPEIERVF